MALYHAGADSPGTYNDGIDLVTRGLLQSAASSTSPRSAPARSGTITLTQDELASNLSYLVAGGPPDQTLLDMGAAGGLATPDGREAQARRLLARSPGAIAWCASCASGWASTASPRPRKDATVYPSFRRARARRWTPRA